ncbi:MAG TPA: VWA domain-containing protein [Spirochaetota bacterium]|nr:VWA domain-containing protein [Spirochaetota bacterium]
MKLNEMYTFKSRFLVLCAIALAGVLLLFQGCGGQRIASAPAYEGIQAAKLAKEKRKMDFSGAAGLVDSMEESPVVHNTEEYDIVRENEFKDVKENPLSTFSIDVDTASYSNVRRFINYNQLPPKDSVRIEEMINYFRYEYPQPQGEHPFSVTTEISEAPWNTNNRLLLIGIQGKSLDYKNLKPSNLVFLLDTSGSMNDPNKLPLLKKSLAILLDELSSKDRISIVAYAGSAGLVLPSTPATKKDKILDAFNSLRAGGSTAGGEGIELAYKIARENLIKEGNNRVILCTDGDFNVGQSSTSNLVRMIEEKRKDDIYLTICGFGMGNYKDGRMEQISNAGNGNYFYVDNIKEAQKIFGREMRANMFTIAKDVKIQIEFNPLKVKGYRLIGYENRVMAKEDFDNDLKDAGELGAGHTVTAMYELIPAGSKEDAKTSGSLKYQETKIKPDAAGKNEIMTLKMRYKPIRENKSKLIEKAVIDTDTAFSRTTDNFRFASSVAGFGMLLRESKFKKDLTAKDVMRIAKASKGKDKEGYRAEFITLVEKYSLLSR